MKKAKAKKSKKAKSENKSTYKDVFDNPWITHLRPNTLKGFIAPKSTLLKIKSVIGKKPPNALLITGETGSGKTTLARLLTRKLVGLENLNTDKVSDVTEINCGENTGIDNIRDTIKSANFAPMRLSRRIFILDEAHLLSKQAISALLKPIEEPLDTTIWILCTNHPDKLSKAIRDRCEGIHLDNLNKKEAKSLIYSILETSKVQDVLQFSPNKDSKKAKEKPFEYFINEVVDSMTENRSFFSPRELISRLQATLQAIAFVGTDDLNVALDILDTENRSFFELDGEAKGVSDFLDIVSHDISNSIKILLDLGNDVDSFDHLYNACRYKLKRGDRDEYINKLFAWCVDAKAWSVHSGMNPLDYVVARMVEK